MSKLPAIQFYPGDWKKDPGVQALSFHDRGVWFEIIMLMHESEQRGFLLLNGKPMPDEALARLLGLDNQNLTTTITTLLTYGVASRCSESGALMCRRMVRDEEIRQVRKAAGSKGGNPILLKQKTTTKVKQKTTPSSSLSTSSSTSIINKLSLDALSVDHNAEWLARKRTEGKYVFHDEHFILEQFKQYCQSKGKRYADYIAGYRNAFEWDRCQPKQTRKDPATTAHDKAQSIIARRNAAAGLSGGPESTNPIAPANLRLPENVC